jgi:hypothetical protein
MNTKGTDAEIETHDIAKYPQLKDLFDEHYPYSPNHNKFKEWELVGQCVGQERIIDFSTKTEGLEREIEQVKKSLSEYPEIVNKAWEYLKALDYENISRERSYKNIDLCSFSDTFYVYDKPFLKLCYRLGHRFRPDSIFTEYDRPCWKIDFFHDSSIHVNKGKLTKKEEKAFDEWLQYMTQEPEDAAARRENIKEELQKLYKTKVQSEEILYDPAAECYILKEDAERRVLKDLLPEHDEDTKQIAKYTTFDTLVAVLRSGKIRMNCIVSMNDKAETDFLENHLRNYKEEYEQDTDKYLFADKEFITSFTKRIDELDMWRLYGDDARVVCMVFERRDMANDDLYKLRYIEPDDERLNKISELLDALERKNIRFRLNLLQKYRHFLKHSDYEAEEEYRLLMKSAQPDGWYINRENGILTPFIEKAIKRIEPNKDYEYPFRLSMIILGPAMSEKTANVMQVFYLAHQYEYYLSIGESSINSYR